jgi:hypothetical protein
MDSFYKREQKLEMAAGVLGYTKIHRESQKLVTLTMIISIVFSD